MKTLLPAVLFILVAGACGQKGPLFLPEPPAEVRHATADCDADQVDTADCPAAPLRRPGR